MYLSSKISGEYRLVVSREGSEIHDTGWFKNLILDSGLNRIGNQLQCVTFAQVGTGTAAPAASQTTLATYLASSSSSGTISLANEGSPLYRTTITVPLVFTQGAVVGNITEVGVGWQSASGGLFSRALVVDGVGNPTTLTLTSIDQLTVYYRLRIAPPVTDGTGSVVISGTTYNYTMRASAAGTFAYRTDLLSTVQGLAYPYNVIAFDSTSTLGAITSAPVGTNSSGTFTGNTYVNGTFYRDFTATFPINQGNLSGGIKCIVFYWTSNGGMSFQCQFSAAIPKDNTKVLTLNIRLAWARG